MSRTVPGHILHQPCSHILSSGGISGGAERFNFTDKDLMIAAGVNRKGRAVEAGNSPRSQGLPLELVRSLREKIKLMRLAWDFIGSEFGNRHQQYEKFYGGASFMNMFRSFDFKSAGALVDNALNLPPIED
jgi:hypothetical protein